MSLRMEIRPLMVCSVLLVASQVASAQVKIAIVDMQRAVFESAEIKQANDVMQATFRPRQQAAEKLQQEIAAIAQQLQTNAGKLTQQAEADLNAEGQRKQREYTRLNEDLQADADRYRQEALSKSSAKMSDIVKKLAEEKGFDLVVERSTALYFKPAMDITGDAIAAYDKAYPAPPPQPPAKKEN